MAYNYTDEGKKHLHSFEGKPLIGTSTVAKMAGGDKPGLIWWAAGCAVSMFGWTKSKDEDGNWVKKETRLEAVRESLENIKQMDEGSFLSLLDNAYKAHMTKKTESAGTGTARHSKLEEYVKYCMDNFEGKPQAIEHWLPGYWAPEIEAFIAWAQGNVKRFLWCEVNCYSLELWTGGIADIGYEDMQGRVVAGDHKSSKEAYFDQFVQIAGYDLELSENGGFDSQGNKIFELPKPIDYYVVFPFRSVPFTPTFSYDVEGYRDAFRAALTLHKLNESFKELAVS